MRGVIELPAQLEDLLEAVQKPLTVWAVIRAVAYVYGTTPQEITSDSRRSEHLRPRQIAMWVCRARTVATLAEIGRAFNRDHPAVTNAIRRVGAGIVAP